MREIPQERARARASVMFCYGVTCFWTPQIVFHCPMDWLHGVRREQTMEDDLGCPNLIVDWLHGVRREQTRHTQSVQCAARSSSAAAQCRCGGREGTIAYKSVGVGLGTIAIIAGVGLGARGHYC